MILKDAFRYQNFLRQMIDQTMSYLGNRDVTTKTTKTHMLKEVDPASQDKVENSADSRTIAYSANQLVDFLVYLIEERTKLSEEISTAKRYGGVDIDARVSTNKMLRNVASVLRGMDYIKTTKRTSVGSAYRFNAEGNQTPVRYNIEEVTRIDFDRNKVKSLYKTLLDRADKSSADVDDIMVTLEVSYGPSYSINDSYEDMIDAFLLME